MAAVKIDFHVHLTPPDISANWEKYAEKEPYFDMISRGKVNKFAQAEDVIYMLENDGFDRAVVFGFAFCDIGLCRYVNDYVIEKVRLYPDKLTGFAVVPPGDRETETEIKRCHDAGLKGVGELFPAGQGIDLEDKKQTQSITKTCMERNIPLLLHANETVGHQYPGKTGVPLHQIEAFVNNNQGLKIVLAHWGGGICFYETMKEIQKKFRDVYYDTAITPYLYDERIYRAAKALGLCEKILFGSDFPIIPPSKYLNGIEKSGLSCEEKALLFGGNAANLLGI